MSWSKYKKPLARRPGVPEEVYRIYITSLINSVNTITITSSILFTSLLLLFLSSLSICVGSWVRPPVQGPISTIGISLSAQLDCNLCWGKKQPRWDSRARAGVGGVPPGSCYEQS